MPASILPTGVSWGISENCLRCTLVDLYEQCSLHITLYIASSELVGRRPRISRIRWYSSALRPRSAQGCSWSGSLAATATVSSTAVNLPAAGTATDIAARGWLGPDLGSGDFLPRVVLGEEPVDAGLVEAG